MIGFVAAVALLASGAGASDAFAAGGGGGSLAARALAAISDLGLTAPASGAVTRADAVEEVVAVAGLSPDTTATATYQDVASTSGAYGAVEAAVQAGLMAGWAPTSGDFDPTGTMSRIDLAILATNALGLGAKATGLADDTNAYASMRDLSRAGTDRGYAVLMLEMGVVPPVSATRFMPNAAVTASEFAVALYRMWLDEDVPASATLTPAAAQMRTTGTDIVTLAATNRLGAPVPAANLARYQAVYTESGGSLSDGVFSAASAGAYDISVSLTGPLLTHPVTATTTVTVTAPPAPPAPLTAPTGVSASEVTGGIAVSWTPGTSITGYQLLEQVNGTGSFQAVPAGDDGTPSAGATSATVTGLTAGDTYTFEVEALGAGGTQATSTASESAAFGASAAAGFVPATDATGTVTLGASLATADTSASLVVDLTGEVPAGATVSWNQGELISCIAEMSLPAQEFASDLPSSCLPFGLTASLTQIGDVYEVTYTVSSAGAAGNSWAVTLTGAGSSMYLNGDPSLTSANFSGGASPDTVTVNGQTLTAVSSSPTNSEYDNSTTLADAISNTPGTDSRALAVGNTVTVTASTPGAAGNSITLSTNDIADATLSGATLTGGSDGTVTLTFSQPMDTSSVTTATLSTVLTPSSGHTFGAGATANWVSDTELEIALGSGATLASGDTITVASTVTDTAGNPVAGPITVP